MITNSTFTLEAKGLRCPLPLLKLKQWLAKADHGDQLLLIVDDPQSIADVPKWLSTTHHALLEIEHQGQDVIIKVQKSND